MKVAIVHYWLVGMRGGEKVLEALCELWPEADIFTHVVVPNALSEGLRRHKIKTSFVAKLPRAASWYKAYLPLMPLALEQFDLRDYDLVISSESGPAKGIVASPHAVHICYCHSPMRYVWNMYHDYRRSGGRVARMSMPLLMHYMRMWDLSSANRVDTFVANSHNVAARIHRYYQRDAHVVYPPVNVNAFGPVNDSTPDDFYLMVGELVRYKRPDLAIETFNASGKHLVIIGGGEMLGELRRNAGPNIKILGSQPFDTIRSHYRRCRALIFPGEEDFGIVPVEAMAAGRPVIAFGRGGATETVVDGVTGVLFDNQTSADLSRAITRFEGTSFEPRTIGAHARAFDASRFKSQMRALVDVALSERSTRNNRLLATAASTLRGSPGVSAATAEFQETERDAA
ncbi:MAG: glycosyltransferase [Xanthobacteraceae bacterium]|nr:glycosyltransferase [Xanthobacteraceae bacterium]